MAAQALDIHIPVRTRRTSNESKPLNPQDFLAKYGYMRRSSRSPEDLAESIKLMQTFYHIPITGVLDNKTIEMMSKPRCGCPDIDPPTTRSPLLPDNPAAYTLGPAWKTKHLTWTINRYYFNTRKITERDQKDAMDRAFKVWAKYAPLSFTYVDRDADLTIGFHQGDHNDGYDNRFDGPGNVLAHAFYPPDGRIHFDLTEDWILSSDDGIEMFTVAAHEFGHALGLGHSSTEYSLMAPVYAGFDEKFELHADDIYGIQLLYGRRQTSRTTASPPINPTNKPGKACDTNFDATVRGHDEYLYAFHGKKVYKIGDTGLVREDSIDRVFRGAPYNIDAAFRHPRTRQVVLLKGARMWLFNRFTLDPSYPKYLDVSNFPARPAAALTFKDKVEIFGGGYYWEWDVDQHKVMHRPGLTYYRYTSNRLPSEFDSILHWKDGYTYIFKDNSYYKMQDDGRRGVVMSGYPKAIGPAWFKGDCEGDTTL
ncbi:hypothetical protein ScPMuIL_005816 [Solemya velum]